MIPEDGFSDKPFAFGILFKPFNQGLLNHLIIILMRMKISYQNARILIGSEKILCINIPVLCTLHSFLH